MSGNANLGSRSLDAAHCYYYGIHCIKLLEWHEGHSGQSPPAEEQNTIDPPPVVIIDLTTGFSTLKQLYRLSFMTCMAWSGSRLSKVGWIRAA